MRKGITSTGFAYEFDETRLDDMRFVDILAEVLSEETPEFDKITGASKLITLLLGKDMKRALYEHIGKDYEDGRVPRAALENALAEIMSAEKDAEKN